MGKIAGWVGSILAAVIGGYIIWYITRPVQIEGMVLDQAQSAAIEKALVTVEVPSGANGPFDNSTDSNGSYGMELSGLGWRTTVTIRAKAKGYRDSEPIVLVIGPGGNRKDLFLVPEVAGSPATGGAAGNSGNGASTPANPNPTATNPPAGTPTATNPAATNPALTHPAIFVKKAFIQKYAVVKKQ